MYMNVLVHVHILKKPLLSPYNSDYDNCLASLLMKRLLTLATLLTAALTITGCSLLFDPNPPKKAPTQEEGASAGITQPIFEKSAAGIEVTWEVPSEPVDGFVIRYGEDRAQLAKETTILISELREERDPQYGPVYRYTIRDISSDTPLYVSVAAFKGDVISDFSDAVLESQRAS